MVNFESSILLVASKHKGSSGYLSPKKSTFNLKFKSLVVTGPGLTMTHRHNLYNEN